MPREPAVVPLSEPIEAHGGTLHQITMRPPTGKDLRLIGNPFQMLGAMTSGSNDMDAVMAAIRVDDAKAMAMIARLADIPPSSVDLMSPGDIQIATVALFGFLAPGAGTSSPPTTSAAGSGVTSNT